MQRLTSPIADRWRATVVPSWLHFHLVPILWFSGAIGWWNAADASWLVLLAFLGAVLVQLGAPRVGCLLGVGCGVLAVVVERNDVLFAWIVLALACLVLLIWREVARARQRALGLGDGWNVRVAFDDEERLALFTADDQEPRLVAFVGVDHPPELEDALAAAPDDDELKERITAAYLRRFTGTAVLVGDLVEGTRPEIVTEAGNLRASGRLRARRRNETFDPLPEVDAQDFPSAPADGAELPGLPWTPKQADSFGLWGWIGLGGVCIVGVLKAVDWLDGGKIDGFAMVVILALLVAPLGVIDDLCKRVVVDRDGLRIRTSLTDRRIPWSQVKDIRRRSGGEVVIDLGDRTRTLSFDGEDERPPSSQVAAVLRTVRRQASTTAGDAATRLSWGAYATTAYLAALAVAAGILVSRL